MDKKTKKKLDTYKDLSYSQIALEAIQSKGNLKRKSDIALLKKSEHDSDALFSNDDQSFQREVTKSLSKYLGLPYFDILNHKINREIARIFPEEVTREQEMIPVLKKGDKLVIAVANPLRINTIDNMPQMNGYTSEFVLSHQPDLVKYISDMFTKPGNDTERLKAVETENLRKANVGNNVSGDVNAASIPEMNRDSVVTIKDESPVSIVTTILSAAIHAKATDVHLEPTGDYMRVRFRVDGMLFEQFRIPAELIIVTVSRIKILSNLDITEIRYPQDGRMTTKIDEKEYHLRISTIPTKTGESVVFRIIQESNIFNGLEHLGLSPMEGRVFKTIISKPHGMVLVTGPIGSGKTTTLYTALNELDTTKNKVVTIEDPVECLLPGISQIEVDAKIDVNFVNSLRSVLRQDADILMVGEIRDTETAKIAVRAALTGQMLLSTLHSVDTISAITTLRNFDVPPFLIASALNGIITQRLVRKICTNCKVKYNPATRLFEQLRIDASNWNIEFAYGQGCNACNGIGYSGRTAIFEIFQITDTMKDSIINEVKESELRELAKKEGLKTLYDAGVQKIIDQVTTPEEVMREIFLKGGSV